MKIICHKCQQEISNEFNNTLSFCTGCGASLNFSEENNPSKNQFSTILFTSLITSILLISFLGLGYLLFFRNNLPTANPTEKPSPASSNKPKLIVSIDEVTKIELNEENYRKNDSAAKQFQFLGNISLTNTTIESKNIKFDIEGKAEKNTRKSVYDEKATNKSSEDKNFIGTISKEDFLEIAKIAIENDFFNQPLQDGNSPTIGASRLTISSSKGNNSIMVNHSSQTWSRIEPILQAINKLNTKVSWHEKK